MSFVIVALSIWRNAVFTLEERRGHYYQRRAHGVGSVSEHLRSPNHNGNGVFFMPMSVLSAALVMSFKFEEAHQ